MSYIINIWLIFRVYNHKKIMKYSEDLQKIIEMFLVDFYYEYYELESTKTLLK